MSLLRMGTSSSSLPSTRSQCSGRLECRCRRSVSSPPPSSSPPSSPSSPPTSRESGKLPLDELNSLSARDQKIVELLAARRQQDCGGDKALRPHPVCSCSKNRRNTKSQELLTQQNDRQRPQASKNDQWRRRQSDIMRSIQRKEREEVELLEQSLEQKYQEADKKYENILRRKQLQLQQKQKTLEENFCRNREIRKVLDEQLDSWQLELQNYRKMQCERADERAHGELLRRRNRARAALRCRQTVQRRNMDRLTEQNNQWEAALQQLISDKQLRCQLIELQKQQHIEQSRQGAQQSRKMRDKVKKLYDNNELTRCALQTEIENQIILGNKLHNN